jgi:hypothetical protein
VVFEAFQVPGHLVFPHSGRLSVRQALACAGRPVQLFDTSARPEERGWEPRADGGVCPTKTR